MQNYQQYLPIQEQPQLPPLQPNLHTLPFLSLTYEMAPIDGVPPKCSYPVPGFLPIKPPTSLVYQLHPKKYAKGFNSAGKIIGANQEVPYPGSQRFYPYLPFKRTSDWYAPDILENMSFSEVLKKEEACQGKDASINQPETAEYFTADNDEGYKKWVAKKIEEQQKSIEKQMQMSVVPQEIKAMPGHVNPSRTETTNEVYGQYIDLRPKYPAVYPLPAKIPPQPMQVLVKFRHSNMSDHGPIPDHAFAVNPQEMINRDGCYTRGIHGSVYIPQGPDPESKTAFTFQPNAVLFGQPVGERTKGFTWPLYTPSGLETNRPLSRCVSVVADVDGKKKLQAMIPPRSVPYIYNRYMSYTTVPGNDLQKEPNPAKCQRKLICVPFSPHASTSPHLDPCNLKFINPQILPVPIEFRKS